MFLVGEVLDKLLKSRCSRLQEITSIVDHRPVDSQVVKHLFGDKPEETNGNRGSYPESQRPRLSVLVGMGAGGQRILWGDLHSDTWVPHPISCLSSFESSVYRIRGLGTWRGLSWGRVQKRPLVPRWATPTPRHSEGPWGLGSLVVHTPRRGEGGMGRSRC